MRYRLFTCLSVVCASFLLLGNISYSQCSKHAYYSEGWGRVATLNNPSVCRSYSEGFCRDIYNTDIDEGDVDCDDDDYEITTYRYQNCNSPCGNPAPGVQNVLVEASMTGQQLTASQIEFCDCDPNG